MSRHRGDSDVVSDAALSGSTKSGIPGSPSEITADWLESVLRESGVLGENHLVSVAVEPANVGFGVMTNTARLRLKYSNERSTSQASVLPASLFVKSSTEATMSIRSTESEVRFYQEVAPRLAIRTPRCYFAGSEEHRHLILLEDLSSLRGGDSLQGCSTETAALIMQEIAALHARWWERKLPAEWEWLRAGPEVGPFLAERFGAIWPGFRDRHAATLGKYVIETCDAAVQRIPEIFSVVTGPPLTLNHGDLQLDNMRFGSDRDRFVLLDWGNVRIASGIGDIVGFLTRSMPIEQSRSNGETLIRMYHDALLRSGVTGYEIGDLQRQLKYGFIFFLFVNGHVGAEIDFSSERARTRFSKNIECGAAAIEDFRAGDVLR